MRITFFNPHPEGEMFAEDAFDRFVGKRLPIKKDGVVLGVGQIIDVKVSVFGVETTLETDSNLGLTLEDR